MRRTAAKISMILILILTSLIVSGCSGNNEFGLITEKDGSLSLVLPVSDENSSVKIPVSRMSADVISAYSIVRPEITDDNTISAAQIVTGALGDNVAKILFTTDWVKRGDEVPIGTKEILVGATNRPESSSEGLRAGDYIIAFESERIVINGGSSKAVVKAAELFSKYFIDTKEGTVLIPNGERYTYRDSYICDSLKVNGVELYEYKIVNAAKNTPAAQKLADFIAELTGYSFSEESENTIVISNTLKTDECSISTDSGSVKIDCGGELSPEIAVRWFTSVLMSESNADMQSRAQKISIDLSSSRTLTTADIAAMEPNYIWVAADGDDNADGSESTPLATVNAARLRAREVMQSSLSPVIVNIRGGEYFMTEPVEFDYADSGIEGSPITYRAYNGEDVRFYGGIRVDKSLVTKADPSIAGKVIDKTASEALMQIDLSGVVDKIPDFYAFGHTGDNSNIAMEIYIGGKALERSRWPNNVEGKAYRRTAEAVHNDDGTVTLSYDRETAERTKLWSDSAKDNLYLFGFLAWDWTNEDYDASGIDFENRTVTLMGGLNSYFNSIVKNTRFYFFNLPEEIDVRGESYIDREKRIAYFYPHDNADYNDIFVSTVTESLFKFNETKHIVVDGIKFLYTRANAISASSTEDFKLLNCEFGHTSSNAASFSGKRILIDRCHVYDTARGGFSVSGGDSVKLIQSENVVSNCEIHGINRAQATYNPGIAASSFGMTIRNNKLYDCVHEMIAVGTNDVTIEYNEFYDCVLESADMGAIYFGRNPALMGTVIRYNYFHDIGNPYGGIGQQSIFIDDGNNGAEIYGNVFKRGTIDSAAIKTHGAQFSNMVNNIFIDMPSCYYNADWGGGPDSRQNRWFLWVYDKFSSNDHQIISKITSVNFDSKLWREHYKDTIWASVYDYIDSKRISEYASLSVDELTAIANKSAPVRSNILKGNVVVNVNELYNGGVCSDSQNYITNDTSIFKDYGKDFSLTDSALTEIRKTYPEFENIPFDRIGIEK